MKQIGTINDVSGTNRMTEYLKKAVVLSYNLARRRDSKEIEPIDLFLAIISEKTNIASRMLEKLGVDISSTRLELEKNYDPLPKSISPVASAALRKVLSDSFLISSELNHVYVGTEHVLLSLLNHEEESFVIDLGKVGISHDSFKQLLLNFGTYQPGLFSSSGDSEEPEIEMQSSLGMFARDMNELAESGKYLRVWGRQDEIDRMVHILSRKTKNNPILVGEAGVGKTAVVEGLVQRVLEGEVPQSFKHKKFIQLDLASIIAGSKIRGDVEERILAIINEVSDDPDKILFIDEIHMIVGAGSAGQGSMDVANILKPYLTTGDIRVIGATTFDEYQKYFETDDALSRRFQPVMVREISKDDAVKVLKSLKKDFEDYHNVIIEDEALVEAANLSARYITDRYFPDKVIDIVDEAAAEMKIKKESLTGKVSELKEDVRKIQQEKKSALNSGDMEKAVSILKSEREVSGDIKKEEGKNYRSKAKKYRVGVEDIKKVVSRWTKVPVESLSSKDLSNIKKLESSISKSIIGQEHAVKEVVSALKRARVGISDEDRPMANFLFLGPTGVGKTELAKVLAAEVMGSQDSLIQVDMSEYMEQHSVAKLIGSPPGYVGYQEGGQLTERIRRNPYSLVLFDEIEKAHPDLLNILLQMMEEGRIQDAKGRNVNCRNTIIIMTSNIGASEIKNDTVLGFDLQQKDNEDDSNYKFAYDRMKEKLTEELKNTLPPEFLNRLDGVVIFRSLNKSDIRKIVKLHLEKLSERLSEKDIRIKYSKAVQDYLTDESFDEEYGGRNVRRKVQDLIETEIAEKILEKKLISAKKDKDEITVNIRKDKDKLTFEV